MDAKYRTALRRLLTKMGRDEAAKVAAAFGIVSTYAAREGERHSLRAKVRDQFHHIGQSAAVMSLDAAARVEELENEPKRELVGRCNCYKGGPLHSPNSGRCAANNGVMAVVGRRGICDRCWDNCGHSE